MSQDRRTKTSDLGDALGRWLRRYRKGQLIVVEGQESHTFVILCRGIVGIYKDGQRVAVISEPGTYLGEMSYLLQDRRTATMRAENDVEAYVMPSHTFDEILESAPRVGLKIMQSLASRLRSTTSDNAMQARQINRLRGGGAAPDIRTSSSDRRGSSYAEQAMGELIFLLRAAIEYDDSPVLLSLLRTALRTDLVPAGVHQVPERGALVDVLAASRGPAAGPVDLKQLIEWVKRNAVTPAAPPAGSQPEMATSMGLDEPSGGSPFEE